MNIENCPAPPERPGSEIVGTFGVDPLAGTGESDGIASHVGDGIIFARGGDDPIIAGMAPGGAVTDDDMVFAGNRHGIVFTCGGDDRAAGEAGTDWV